MRPGFSVLLFLGQKGQHNSQKNQTEKRPREIQKLFLFKYISLNSKLTLLDVAKQKPSIPLPGLLQSWPVLDDSQCTAGPRSGLSLTTERGNH